MLAITIVLVSAVRISTIIITRIALLNDIELPRFVLRK
jgi:hypothetical protein